MAEESTTSAPWPPATSSAFMPHAKVQIKAPASMVYELLTSPSSWPKWNAFVPSAHLLSRKNADGKDEHYIYDTSHGVGEAKYKTTPQMKLGDVITFNVELPMSGKGPSAKRTKSTSTEVIVELTVPEEPVVGAVYRATWDVLPQFGRPTASRTNEIEVLGEEECEYRSWEVFSGLLTYVVKYAVGKAVQTGFDEWLEGLKREAEKRWKEQKAQKTVSTE